MKNYKKYLYTGLPIIGILFYLFYLHIAAIDIVYSDYIRLVNAYLPDVWNPDKFFVPDLLTRIPINYLERGINVEFFGYSVTFDRVMGVLSFGLSAVFVGIYSWKRKIGLGWYVGMVLFTFSLNKWEMLYNGTGWVHFLAFACFYYNYLVLDRYYSGGGKRGDLIRLAVLPGAITIFVAGPYCAIYIMTLVLSYLFIFVRNLGISWKRQRKPQGGFWNLFGGVPCAMSGKQIAGFLFMAIWPLFLYLWSHSHAVYEYSGATELSLTEALTTQPLFFIKFFLKSFASMVFGTELISRRLSFIPGKVWCLVGLLVILAYFLAVWMNFYYKIVDRTIFPLMMLAGGGMNHLMILVSRWIFIPSDIYGMSSRYALQYQIGIVGIFLTFALAAQARKKPKEREKQGIGLAWERRIGVLAAVIALCFVVGNIATTVQELDFAKHRKIHNEYNHKLVWDFETESDEILARKLEYSKDGLREALTILKENQWNIFGQDPPYYPELLDREPD